MPGSPELYQEIQQAGAGGNLPLGFAPTIERTTYQSYESIITARLEPFFRERKLRLCDIEPKHIRELHQSIFADGCNANTVIHYLDYVCVDEMGKLFRPNHVTDHFKLLLQQNGLRHIRFHDLRHSCASLLLSQGIAMKQIQDWLGHSTFATTADIYSHLDFNSKQESADAIAAAFMPEETAEEEQVQGFSMTMSM